MLDRFPLVRPGDHLAGLVLATCERNDVRIEDGDILVLAQKVVSKAEGRQRLLRSITPGREAVKLAARTGKDPRLVELILSEAEEVVRVGAGFVIVRHRLGMVMANAGIDQSNIDHGEGASALLLPVDPDRSAARLRADIEGGTGRRIGVLIIDSIGRAWRMGTIGTTIGAAGVPTLVDLRGTRDLHGRKLETSELAFADEVAAAASLLMGQADEGTPLAIVRGLDGGRDCNPASSLIRSLAMDLFR